MMAATVMMTIAMETAAMEGQVTTTAMANVHPAALTDGLAITSVIRPA